MRYVGYVRISSEEQRGNYSLAAQKHAIQSWVVKQQGLRAGILLQVYEDECFTGLIDSRPAFQQMMQDARQGKFDALVVHKWDRLNRSRCDAIHYKAMLRREYQLKLFVVEGISEDEDELVGMVFEAMTEVWSELYSRNLSRETQKGKQQKAREGKHNNRAPFGVDKAKNGILHANPKELPGLLLAMESYSTGRQSDNSVAQIVNQAGYVTKQGKPFTGESVREMLQNRIYIGQVRYQRYRQRCDGSRDTSTPVEWFTGQHPPLVPIELFERCQEIRRLLRRRPNRAENAQFYLLGGLLYCEQCGHRLRAQKSPCGKSYYHCVHLVEGKPCQRRMLRTDLIEPQVLAAVSRVGLSSENLPGSNIENTRLEKQSQDLEQAITRLDWQWQQGLIAQEPYLAQRTQLQQQLTQLCPFSKLEREGALELLKNVGTQWTSGDRVEQKRLLHRLLECIWVDGNQATKLKLRPAITYWAQQIPGLEIKEGVMAITGF
ncbi:MAG: recombinase family protein [Chloroflexi bacterium]|nr:recombinase family protein [Chloroflexota bacterium]